MLTSFYLYILVYYRRRQWHPTPVFLPGEPHGQRSLVGCSPWGRKESDMTERLHFHFSLSCIGEGNGNPLQCSCLENPRDIGASWAAVYRVAQSHTQLKWLSSSSLLHLQLFPFHLIIVDTKVKTYDNYVCCTRQWKDESVSKLSLLSDFTCPNSSKKKKKKVFFAPLHLWSTVTVAHLSPLLTFPPRSQLVLTGFSFWAAGKQLSMLHPLLPPPQRTHRLPPRLQVPRAAWYRDTREATKAWAGMLTPSPVPRPVAHADNSTRLAPVEVHYIHFQKQNLQIFK